MVYSLFNFSEAVTKFVPSIHSVYLTENENVVQPEDISKAKKIHQTLKKLKLERKCSQNGYTFIKFFEDLFTCSGIGARMKSSVAMLKPVKGMINVAKCQGSYG